MKYVVFPKEGKIVHCQSGVAKCKDIFHIRRNMPMTEIMFMTEGELHIRHLEEYCLKEGDIFILPQNVLHYGTKESSFSIHWVHLILPKDLRIVEEDELSKIDANSNMVLPILFHSDDIQSILDMVYKLEQYFLSDETQMVRDAIMRSILCDLAYRYRGINLSYFTHKRLNSIVNYINSNIDRPITVKDLSDKFGYNGKYIFNLFKRYLGVSPLQYIIKLKMNQAKNDLLSSEDTVEAIAYNVGYENPHYFVRLFKKSFNCTPTEFRKTFSHSFELFYSKEQ